MSVHIEHFPTNLELAHSESGTDHVHRTFLDRQQSCEGIGVRMKLIPKLHVFEFDRELEQSGIGSQRNGCFSSAF